MAFFPNSSGTALHSINGNSARRASGAFIETANTAEDNIHSVNNSNKIYRRVPLDDIIARPNKNGIENCRLIVPEENNTELVKEYTKKNDSYYCVACYRKNRFNSGKIDCNAFLTPVFHFPWCHPISREEAVAKVNQKVQKELRMPKVKIPKSNNKGKQGQTKCSPAAKLNSAILKDDDETDEYTAKSRRSPSIEIISVVPREKSNCEGQSTSYNTNTEEFRQVKKRFAEDVLPDPTPPKIQKRVIQVQNNEEISSAISEQNDVDFIQAGAAKSCDFYRFHHPATHWLRNACEKLKLTYTQNAYKFWGNIDIVEITETSEPQYIQQVKCGKNSCFRAISFLLSGEEDKAVKKSIKNYFFDNYKTLGVISGHDLTVEKEVVKETIFSEVMTPILWGTLAKLLECRIGIFENEEQLKYGDWSNNDDNEIITLLFKKENDNYSIITKLIDPSNVSL